MTTNFKPIEKKPRWTNTIRAKIKDKFLRWGITYCELRYEGCTDFALGFAHSLKQRKIRTTEEMEQVILACQRCHQTIEHKPAEEMFRIVTETIKGRIK